MKRLNLIASLEAIPVEIDKARAQIAAAAGRVEEGRQLLLAMQVRRKELAGKADAAGEQVVRYKTQQLQVKKNEEYQALGSEIGRVQAQIADLEDEELALLLQIDEQERTFAGEQEQAAEEIALLEREVKTLQERQAVLAAQRAQAQSDADAAASAVAPAYIEAYQRVGQRKARQPWVVAITEHKCGGCHLKISGESESMAREAERPVHCDSCGRIVYWD